MQSEPMTFGFSNLPPSEFGTPGSFGEQSAKVSPGFRTWILRDPVGRLASKTLEDPQGILGAVHRVSGISNHQWANQGGFGSWPEGLGSAPPGGSTLGVSASGPKASFRPPSGFVVDDISLATLSFVTPSPRTRWLTKLFPPFNQTSLHQLST